MSVSHTTRYALPAPNGDDPISNGDNVFRDAMDLVDAIIATGWSDTFGDRPAAGKLGRLFYATDTDTVYFDTGSAWTGISPRANFTAGTLASRGATGAPGRQHWATDAKVLLMDTGESTWRVLSDISGYVTAAGLVARGDGFIAEKIGLGTYRITVNAGLTITSAVFMPDVSSVTPGVLIYALARDIGGVGGPNQAVTQIFDAPAEWVDTPFTFQLSVKLA